MKNILLILLIYKIFLATAMAEERIFIVGVEPKQNPVLVAEKWMPFLRDLSNISDLDFRFRTSKDVLEYNRALENGEFDFVISSPYLTTIFAQKYNIEPIAKIHHADDLNGLALIGQNNDLTFSSDKTVSVGISANQRYADLQSISQFLSLMGHSYIIESYPNSAKVVEAVKAGFSQFGIIIYEGNETEETISNNGLRPLWIDEQPKFSYLSVASSSGEQVVLQLRDAFTGSENNNPWMQQHGIANIEVMGNIFPYVESDSLSWLNSQD